MNHPWHDIEPGDPEEPIAFVEIPRGTKTKYEQDAVDTHESGRR